MVLCFLDCFLLSGDIDILGDCTRRSGCFPLLRLCGTIWNSGCAGGNWSKFVSLDHLELATVQLSELRLPREHLKLAGC